MRVRVRACALVLMCRHVNSILVLLLLTLLQGSLQALQTSFIINDHFFCFSFGNPEARQQFRERTCNCVPGCKTKHCSLPNRTSACQSTCITCTLYPGTPFGRNMARLKHHRTPTANPSLFLTSAFADLSLIGPHVVAAITHDTYESARARKLHAHARALTYPVF